MRSRKRSPFDVIRGAKEFTLPWRVLLFSHFSVRAVRRWDISAAVVQGCMALTCVGRVAVQSPGPPLPLDVEDGEGALPEEDSDGDTAA